MDKIIFSGEVLEIASCSIHPSEDTFLEKDVAHDAVFVFPKTSIWIKHEGREKFVADPTIINFYNKGQVFQRYSINPNGDNCHWICINKGVLCEVMGVSYSETKIFKFQKLRCSQNVFLSINFLLNKMKNNSIYDEMFFDELILDLFFEIVNEYSNKSNSHGTMKTLALQKKLVEKTKYSIHENLDKNMTLSELSKMNFTSPHHLCRVFKKISGCGINEFRSQLRLRTIALELNNKSKTIGELALEYGYGSLSHLSYCFKKQYGCTPTEFSRVN